MTKITINIDTEGDEPKVTTTTENTNADILKVAPPKMEAPKETAPKEESPKEEKKEETSPENEAAKDASPDKGDSKKMDMTEEEHAKMNKEKPTEKESSKDESAKKGDQKMDMSNEEHAKMEHGNAPMGMEGHDHNKMIADFRLRFFICLGISIPIMILSPMLQKLVGINWQFAGSQYVAFALSTVVFFYGGVPFLKGFWNK